MITHVRNAIAATPPPRGRDLAIVAAFAISTGLAGQAARLALAPAAPPDGKAQVRLAGGAIEKRELAFTPREAAADASIRTFKPDRGWTAEPTRSQHSATPPVAQAQPPAPAAARQIAWAPLPPARPASLTRPVPATRAVAVRHETQRTMLGLNLPRFVPTGGDILRGISGLGATMGDSIGSVGSSLGRLMRVSSR